MIGNRRKMAENVFDILKKTMLAFVKPVLYLSGKKNYCYSEFFTVSVKMPKILQFQVTEPKN